MLGIILTDPWCVLVSSRPVSGDRTFLCWLHLSGLSGGYWSFFGKTFFLKLALLCGRLISCIFLTMQNLHLCFVFWSPPHCPESPVPL